ncbi:MAG: RIP metalloprotease RseP [Candidatus Erginobacter occultus]|nr:RIP metalloprotease RseP [Candidatus Erginobacter occultus]
MPAIPPAIINIAKFVVLLGILIFVHELGHFLLARRFGVYVKKFYLGFDIGGLKIFRFRGKETEYGIGILPLGGYVKMAGQEDLPPGDEEGRKKLEEENKDIPPDRRFDKKPLHQRAAIVAAGPVMNLLLGVGLFVLIARIGIRTPGYLTEPRVGWVEEGMPAERAGIRPGDLVREIAGRPVGDWEDLRRKLRATRAGEELEMVLEGEGPTRTVAVVPERFPGIGYSQIGISPAGKVTVWGLQTDSPAARAGLRTGDILVSLNGEDLLAPAAVGDFLKEFSGELLNLEIFRPETGEQFSFSVPAEYSPYIPGLYLEGGQVTAVDPRAEGAVGKLKKGDRVVEIGGRPVDPEEVAGRIASASQGEEMVMTFHRSGWFVLKPASRITVGLEVSSRAVLPGVTITYDPEPVLIRYYGLAAIPAGLRMGVERAGEVLEVFYLLVTGRLGGAAVGGPVMIFQVTSYVRGLSEFLALLALISVNLGLINLVPLPVLDGGHLLFFGVEGIIRRPLPPRVTLAAQQVGLAVIAVLILLITYKDVLRLLGY